MSDFSPLPTSEEELEAQANEAFGPEPKPAPDAKDMPGGSFEENQEQPEPEAEYLPPEFEPSEELIGNICGFIDGRVNPKLVSLGTSELSADETQAIAGAVAELGGFVPNPVNAVMAKASKMSPLGQALIGVGFALGACAVPRIIDAVLNRNMRDVTPEREDGAQPAPEQGGFAPMGGFDAAG